MANNGFSINVNTILNTSNVPKDLEKIQTKLVKAIDIPIKIKDVDLKSGSEVWSKAVKSLRTYKDELGNTYQTIVKLNQAGQNFVHIDGTIEQEKLRKITEGTKELITEVHKWTDSKGDINTWTTTIDSAGNKITTRVKESVSALGEITTETSKWGQTSKEVNGKLVNVYGQIGETIKKTTEFTTEMTTTTSSHMGQIVDTVNGVQKSYQGLITTTEKVGENGEYLRTVISKYTDELGRTIEKTEQFNKAGDQVATTMRKIGDAPKLQSTSKDIEIIKKDTGELVKTITSVNAQGEVLKTTISTIDNGLGRITTTTRVYNETLQKEVSLHQESINNQAKIAEETQRQAQLKQQLLTVTKQEEQIIAREGTTVKALVTTTKEQSHEYGEITTKVIQYTNALGQTVVETEKLDAKGNALAQSTKVVTQEIKKSEDATKRLGQAQNETATKSKTLGQSLSLAFTQLARFYVASLPIRVFTKAISESITVIKDFDAAITEMGKVADYSGDELRKYTEDLADLGQEVARTQTEMTEAATGWLKAGYSEEDAALLSRYSALLQNTADEQISAAEATSILVSQLKAYHMEANEAIKVTDIINKVSANQAVSSYDISQGLTMASAAMATFGNNIEETTALLTAGTTIFQGKSRQVARGLNMIATRVAKNEEELKKYGVSINDANGDLKSTYEILVELAPAWNKMSEAEKIALGNTLAGTNQYKVFAAIMSQMDVAVEAYDQALNASGETMKQNAVYMDSLEAKTTALKAEFEKLVIGKGGLQDFAKGLVEIGTSVLGFINKMGGLPSLLITVTSLLVGINAINIYKWMQNVYGGIQNIIYALPRAIGAWQLYLGQIEGVEAGMVGLGTAIEASIPIIGMVAVGIGLVTSAIIAHNRELEEQKQKIRENIESFSDEYKSLEEVQNKLKDENISREELNSIIDSNLDEYDAERLKLLSINQARQEAIDLIEAEKEARAQELVDTGLTEYEASLDRIKNGYNEISDYIGKILDISQSSNGELTRALEESGLTNAQTAEEQEKALTSFKNELIKLRSEYEKGSYAWTNYNFAIEESEIALKNLKEKIDEDTKIVKLFNTALKTLGLRYDETSEKVEEGAERWGETIRQQERAIQKTKESINITQQQKKELESLKEQYKITEESIYDYIEAHEEENLGYYEALEAILAESGALNELNGNLQEIEKAYENSRKSANSLVSNIKEVASALKEQEEQGSINIETQSKLIDAGYALALSYDKETGACKIDTKAVVNMTEAKIKAEIAAQEVKRAELSDMLIREAQAATINAQAFFLRAKAMGMEATASYAQRQANRGYNSSISGDAFGYASVAVTESIEMLDGYNKTIESLQEQLESFGKNGVKAFENLGKAASGAGKSAKSAAKDAEQAAKDAKKALEDLKSKYDKAIKYIEKLYDRKINAIKKDKDTALDSIEKQIKALEKEKDSTLDNVEKQINSLKDLKDARKDYWDEQIDALKKANDAKKDAIELQEKLDALEKAKNTKVKVYKEGQGFVYDVDQTAVAEAQKALDEYLSEQAYEEELSRLEALRDAEIKNYEERIDALDKYKDRTQESYEKQIENLKEHKQALSDQYDAEIELYQNYKQQFQDMVSTYEDEQSKLLVSQLTTIDLENDNWMTRLENLQSFVDEYKRLLKQIEDANATSSVGTPTTSNATSTTNATTSSIAKKATTTKAATTPAKTTTIGSNPYQNAPSYARAAIAQAQTKVLGSHASGIDSIKQDEIAIVGENPNQEIVIGSKINNGQLMSLDKGAGVVNADSSNTLAGLLNQISKFGSSGFGSGNGTLSNITNDSLVINGVTIEGSNIKDPQTFVNGLLSLKAEALQRAYKHR